ncbi:MAG TPA: class I SAM-dependent methyltransferase [Verrucomicrobiae bacterium]|nr:class I SAM-dependent methyltransferase [Verrucomicrobiae bacterium]
MSFDRLAPHYRWMEIVLAGEKLQSCRTAFLGEIRGAERVLILGEGNGRFLLECRKVLGSAHITCVDSSRRMIELARCRLSRNGVSEENIEFIHADALIWEPPARSFDALATHFFLDCFQPKPLTSLLERLGNACGHGAKWLLADFQIPARGLRRLRARLIHRSMYCFFGVATRLQARRLTDPDPCLQSLGFTLQRRLTADWGLLRSDLWQLTGNVPPRSMARSGTDSTRASLALIQS